MDKEGSLVTLNFNTPKKTDLQFWFGVLAEERSRLA